MAHFNTFCKQLDLYNGIMIRLWYRQKRICYFCIFSIRLIIIHIFLSDQILNIRGISEIIQKTGKNFYLAVDSLSGLFQNGRHILHFFFPEQTAHAVMTIQYKQDHGNQAGCHKKNSQLMTIFHILKFILYDCRYFHPLHRFLSDRTPGCFHNIP